MIQNERTLRHALAMQAAGCMLTAARTAPKGKGMDMIEAAVVTDEDIGRLSEEMCRINEETGLLFLLRDADNIRQAEAVVIIGTALRVHGLNCAHCGYATCAAKPDETPCALNAIDVGIAVGSACSAAADARVDTRVMFSAGLAAQRLGMLGDCRCVIAIPLSISSKNPFFDRKSKG